MSYTLQKHLNPDRTITKKVMYFQFRFMGWDPREAEEEEDRYSTLPFGYVCMYDKGKMVGCTNLLKREIDFKNNKVVMGGFGGVCTHEEYRRQGVATSILNSGMEVLKESGCDIAYLCTDISKLGSLYESVGFKPLGRKYRATGLSGKIYTDESGMIASVNSDDIFNKILNDEEIFDLQGQDW